MAAFKLRKFIDFLKNKFGLDFWNSRSNLGGNVLSL